MTTFKCKVCGSNWSEGPTRDYNDSNYCRYCLTIRNDELEAEVIRLSEGLKTANKNHEHFEREWYLRGFRIEQLEILLAACREQVDVEDRYVHDLTPIIEAMEALES